LFCHSADSQTMKTSAPTTTLQTHLRRYAIGQSPARAEGPGFRITAEPALDNDIAEKKANGHCRHFVDTHLAAR
jgi:hypothetical protein